MHSTILRVLRILHAAISYDSCYPGAALPRGSRMGAQVNQPVVRHKRRTALTTVDICAYSQDASVLSVPSSQSQRYDQLMELADTYSRKVGRESG